MSSFSFLRLMQQYFVDIPLNVGDDYVFTSSQAHHAKTVVRLDHETVRLVYQGKAYFAEAMMKDKQFIGHVFEEDKTSHEMNCEVTLAVALIRKEKFELVLQKATELGVSKIVPFESSRCVVHAKKEKADKQKARWQSILQEASEQCKRNKIPEITEIISFKKLKNHMSEGNFACYENAYGKSSFLSECAKDKKSITLVIGCEGGFSTSEVEEMEHIGFEAITLGSRILRAETASMYACSILSEMYEVRK